ncbi:Thiosulfate sulfurtransferase [Neofusicoccum parvum]|uniref:Putative thiosulfate sulfurtransferase protein n=1 Tax=Botryosphaeria parva (strain UCR-NP2) TaxID=1287680 RepID=R1GHY1_BOTPV|nr:putative thiosulfate sulfurtransferase protein [Neofusicoccum parvum UCRNP2]GME38146.1 Thiosulfate sulfurtransferase [Neofusicoccum parvum]
MSSSYTLTSYLVSPAQLSDALQKNVNTRLSTAPRVIPLCGTWFLPNDPEKRTGPQTFHACRIPKARFFDLDAVKDQNSPYPHMLPSSEDFAKAMGELGIRKDDSVVVYDSKEQGIFSAPRVAWTLKVFGHQNVHILNNFKLWVEEGYPTEWGEPDKVDAVDYPVPELDRSKVVDFEQVTEIAKRQGESGKADIQILDARSKGRWEGLSSGHIPSSTSVPVPELLDPKTKTFLPAAELKKILESKGIDPSKPVISSCGTGVTAAVIDAALAEAGFPEETRQLYDGSWTEWAQRADEKLIIKV